MRRTHSLFAILAAGLFVSRIGLAEPPRFANANSDAPPLEQAERALDHGDWHVVCDTLLPVWKRAPSPEVAVTLARAELELGLVRDAAEHFAYALHNLPPNDGTRRFFAQTGLDRAKQFIVTLHVHARAGAEIFVDGDRVGTAPLGREVFVEDGPHTVEARLAGFSAPTESFNAVTGTVWRIDVQLDANPPAPIVLAPIKTAAPPPPPARSGVPTIVLGAISAATLGTGVAFTVALASGSGDSTKMQRDAAIFMSAGLMAAGAAFTYALWPSSAKVSSTAVHAAPLVTLGGAGLSIGGSM